MERLLDLDWDIKHAYKKTHYEGNKRSFSAVDNHKISHSEGRMSQESQDFEKPIEPVDPEEFMLFIDVDFLSEACA